MPENFDNDMEEKAPQTNEERQEVERRETKKVVDRIIRGVNDTFVKSYDYDDIDVHFTIKIKAPNALEIGKIQGRLSGYLNGMNNYASDYMLTVYQTLATLRVVGIDVPKELAKDEDIYNLDIIYTIGRDFTEWLNQFRI